MAIGLFAEVIGNGGDGFLQCGDKQVRHAGMYLVILLLHPIELLPVPANPLQGAADATWRGVAQGMKQCLIKLGGVHTARAVD